MLSRPATDVMSHVKARISRQWESSWNNALIRTASRDTSAVSKALSQPEAERRACSASWNSYKA